jgi:hypothetical protein
MGTALIGAGAFCTFVSQLEYILVVDLLTSFVDAYADLPRRLIWQICRFCPCRKHGITLNLRLYPSSRWSNHVFKTRSWLGELASRFCRAWPSAQSHLFSLLTENGSDNASQLSCRASKLFQRRHWSWVITDRRFSNGFMMVFTKHNGLRLDLV